MSSKASEILGVRPSQLSHHRNVTSREGAVSRSSQASRHTFRTVDTSFDSDSYAPSNKRARTDRNRLQKSDRSAIPSSKTSIDSAHPSVRFADSSLASRTSSSTLRPETNYDTALPEISRRPPSSWRGLSTKGSKTWKPMSARQSEESMASRHGDDQGEQVPRNRTLLRSALSRLTLRSPKSRGSLSDKSYKLNSNVSTARPSAAPSTLTSTTTSAYVSGYTTANATPRALSPTRPVTGVTNPTGSARIADSGSPVRKQKRLNSRMPIDVQRPPTRNWVEELDDLDVGDGSTSARHPHLDSNHWNYEAHHQRAPQNNFAPIESMEFYGATSRGLNGRSTPDYNFPEANYYPQFLPPTHTTYARRSKQRSIEPAKKRSSKRPGNVQYSHSILSLSDSEGEGSVILYDTGDSRHSTIRQHRNGFSSAGSVLSANDTWKASKSSNPMGRSRHRDTYKTPAAILSVLRLDDEVDLPRLSTSLPSLVESSSSRQNSSVSTASHPRDVVSDHKQGVNLSIPGGREDGSKKKGSTQIRSSINGFSAHFPGSDLNDDHVPPAAVAITLNDGYETQPIVKNSDDLIMASISQEEAALLSHIRRQRAKALNQLQPESPIQEVQPASDDETKAELSADTKDQPRKAPGAEIPEIVEEQSPGATDRSSQQSATEEEQERFEYRSPGEDDEQLNGQTHVTVSEESDDDTDSDTQLVSDKPDEKTSENETQVDYQQHIETTDKEPIEEELDEELSNHEELTKNEAIEMEPTEQDSTEATEREPTERKLTEMNAPENEPTKAVPIEMESTDTVPTEDGPQGVAPVLPEEVPDDPQPFQANGEESPNVADQPQLVSNPSDTTGFDEDNTQLSPKSNSVTMNQNGHDSEEPVGMSSTPPRGPSSSKNRPPPPIPLHQRQRSIAYREARSKFEQATQPQPKSSLLPVRRKRNSPTSSQSSSPAGNTRPVKEISQIPRLRESKSASPRPVSIAKASDRLTSFQASDSSSGDATSAHKPSHDYFSHISPSADLSKMKSDGNRPIVATRRDVQFESDSSREEVVQSSSIPSNKPLSALKGISVDPTSADEGDDEMTGSALASASSLPRPINRDSGARYVLEAWQALGGGR